MNNHRNPIGIVKKVFINKIVIEAYDLSRLDQNYSGVTYKLNGVNDFICIKKNLFEKIVYQITGLYEDEKSFIKDESSKFESKAFFEAVPVGELNYKDFEFGLSKYPMIGDEIYIMTNEEFDCIFECDEELTIKIGYLVNRLDYFPNISLDNLLTTHVSVLGNTGSGKSTTVRRMLIEIGKLIEEKDMNREKINFYIFDIHEEYGDIAELDEELYKVYDVKDISIPLKDLSEEDWLNLLTPSQVSQLPVLINSLKLANLLENPDEKIDEDWLSVFCAYNLYGGQQTDAVAKRAKIRKLLREVEDEDIQEAFKNYSGQYGSISGDNPKEAQDNEKKFENSLLEYLGANKNGHEDSIENISDANKILTEKLIDAKKEVGSLESLQEGLEYTLLLEEAEGNSSIRGFCSGLSMRIDFLQNIYSDSLFSNDEGRREKFREIIRKDEIPFKIINISDFEDKDLLFLTSFILEKIYEEQKEDRGTDNMGTYNMVFDEAHTYIKEDSDSIFNPIGMFEKIAKEGRKFGIYMLLSSQRPSELSKTVLSQCNNYVLHRIRNNLDLEQIRRSIPYVSDNQINRLSFLETGVVLMVGDAFSMPLELKIKGEGKSSTSSTIKPSNVWLKKEQI